MPLADIGMIGLAVMGRNLALNLADRGYTVSVFDRDKGAVDGFLAGVAGRETILGAGSLEELTGRLKLPRRLMMMIQAGPGVDALIEMLVPLLEPGDIIIDGGNSRPGDTSRRTRTLAAKGLLFVGAGISGGGEGARKGPAIMAGGNPAAWPWVQELFRAIAARANGEPCCAWMGKGGAGHFVKMVHNGIEYGEMQLICESYDFLRRGLGLGGERLQTIFADWSRGVLNSYLIEITVRILGFREPDGGFLVDRILDAAGQKGTGRWMGISAFDLGVPATVIGEAVSARSLSARKEERARAARLLLGPGRDFTGEVGEYIRHLHDALYASKIICHAQGFLLLRKAVEEYGWQLDCRVIARLWRGGCILRSALLEPIAEAFAGNDLENLLLDEFFRRAINEAQYGWRKTVAKAVELGVPAPALSSALAYYDGYRSSLLPANLLQAQRDYFGAHGYERVDQPRGDFFRADWTGGGDQASSTGLNL